MFKRIEKGHSRDLLIIPGWGFDPYCFKFDLINFNLILPQRPFVYPEIKKISEVKRISGENELFCLGWSLGAHIAADIKNILKDDLSGLILVSVIESFKKDEINQKIREIRELGKEKALKTFYLFCFKGQERDIKDFKRTHEKRCMEFWGERDLIDGLKYLKTHNLSLKRNDYKGDLIILGKYDPFLNVSTHKGVNIYFLDTGHLPFLRNEFYDILNDFKKRN